MLKTTGAIAAVILVAGAALAFVGCHARSPEGRADWFVEKMTRELELDESQAARLDDIKGGVLEKVRQARADRGIIRETVMAELEKDTIDQERLNRLVDERIARAREIAAFAIAELADFHAELTPVQREKLVAEVRTWPERHGRWHRECE